MLNPGECFNFSLLGDKSIFLCVAGNLIYCIEYFAIIMVPVVMFMIITNAKNKFVTTFAIGILLGPILMLLLVGLMEIIYFLYKNGVYTSYIGLAKIVGGVISDIEDLVLILCKIISHTSDMLLSCNSKTIGLTLLMIWLTIVSSWILFRFRIRARWACGLIEAAFGISVIVYSFWQIFNSINVTGYWLAPLLSSIITNDAFTWKITVQFVGGVYIVIRGIDNIDKYIETEHEQTHDEMIGRLRSYWRGIFYKE